MSEYQPRFTPGQTVTRTATAAITGGQLLTISGDRSVAPTSAAANVVEGTAGFDAAVGQPVTVYAGGVQKATASAAITAGQRVQAAANGQIAPWSGSNPENIIGHATIAAASGAPCTWRHYAA